MKYARLNAENAAKLMNGEMVEVNGRKYWLVELSDNEHINRMDKYGNVEEVKLV